MLILLILILLGLAITSIFQSWFRRKKGEGISIIIPFRASRDDLRRTRNLEWVVRYWKAQLPDATIIIGEDFEADKPFSKSIAVNNAVKHAIGDILVITDADGYVDTKTVVHCASEIRKARRKNLPLWFVPYRRFYRLTESASRKLLESSPEKPLRFSMPPNSNHIQGDADPNVGHWYGAMIHILPREAFDVVGGWDPRFRGWGGEDHAAMRAMDTLYWPHKTLPNQVLHIWHPQLGPKGVDAWVHWKERMWEGQTDPAVNDLLSWRYYYATNNYKLMRKLVDEGLSGKEKQHLHKHHLHHRKSC